MSLLYSFCKFAFEAHPPEVQVTYVWVGDVAISVHACVMESVCVNSCPCADPAELQPASLVPTDPSCCLIAQRKPITLKPHNTLAVRCRCLFSVLSSFLTIHGCRCHVYSAPAVKCTIVESRWRPPFWTILLYLDKYISWFIGCTLKMVLWVLNCILFDKTMFQSFSL